jgi:acetoin utilization deacetylase AcuC-like enzyme
MTFRVLYISLHCADAFPPNEGHPNDSGKGQGLGFNINIGWLNFVNIYFMEKKFNRKIFFLGSTSC